MSRVIMDEMAFTLDLLERDARALDMKLLVQILSMAAVELNEARNQNSFPQNPPITSTLPERDPVVIGSWQWNPAADRLSMDPEVAKFINLDPEVASFGVPLAILIDSVHAVDRQRVAESFARAVSHDEPLHLVFRIMNLAGSTKRLFVVGRTVFEDGKATRLPGTIVDVTRGYAQLGTDAQKAASGFRRPSRSGKNRAVKEWLL